MSGNNLIFVARDFNGYVGQQLCIFHGVYERYGVGTRMKSVLGQYSSGMQITY